MKLAIIWLALALIVLVGIGGLNWPSYRRLAVRGVQVQAAVVELLPNAHNTVRYEYRVGQRVYEGQSQSRQPNPPLDKLRIGQVVTIYYDPEHPETSVLGDPTPILQNETISIALAAFGVPTFVVASWAWRRSRKRL
jgi:uncharacterized protein DUF3592